MTFRRFAPGLLLLAWTGLMAAGLRGFPPVYFDEVEYANHAWNLSAHGQARFSLYDDVYPDRFKAFRLAWPPLIRPFSVALFAAVEKVAGPDLTALRAFALLAAAATLALLLGLAKDFPLAVLVLAVHPYFIMVAKFVRPEIFLTLASLGAFALWRRAVGSPGISWAAAAGFLAGLLPGFHTNGIAVLAALTALWPASQGRALLRDRRVYAFLAAAVAGLGVWARFCDWDNFLPGTKFLFFHLFNEPPLLAGRPLAALVGMVDRYFQPWVFPTNHASLWALVQAMGWVFCAASAAAAAREKTGAPPLIRDAARLFFFLVLAFGLIVGYKAPSYATVLLPFGALATGWAAAVLVARGPREKRFALALLGWLVVGSALFVVRQYRPGDPFGRAAAGLRQAIPADARVAGPMIYWFAFPTDNYRDIGALTWHRLLAAERDLPAQLAAFAPEYVILTDESAARLARFSDKTKARPASGLLPRRHTVTAQVEGADGEKLYVIRMDEPWK